MGSRLDLHADLIDVLGSSNVYYQPPESVKLSYPCIVYSLDRLDKRDADDSNYKRIRGYSIVAIGKDPDTEIIDSMLDRFKYCRFDRRYVSDNLYHDAFIVYY